MFWISNYRLWVFFLYLIKSTNINGFLACTKNYQCYIGNESINSYDRFKIKFLYLPWHLEVDHFCCGRKKDEKERSWNSYQSVILSCKIEMSVSCQWTTQMGIHGLFVGAKHLHLILHIEAYNPLHFAMIEYTVTC